jgi:PX domain
MVEEVAEAEEINEIQDIEPINYTEYIVDIINTHEEGTIKKFTVYEIQTKYKDQVFLSLHRFQDFKKFHAELITIIPTLGDLPSSSIINFSTSAEVVNERKKYLEKYLQGILQIDELRCHKPVKEFLNLPGDPI